MPTSCAIKFTNGKALRGAMTYLFKRGFVFTYMRYKTLYDAEKEYPASNKDWLCIYVGHEPEGSEGCKMVMNTGIDPYNWGVNRIINFRHFVKHILPTW
jgi:hypothetical protein